MHFVYILYSKQADQFYIGESAFPEGRLQQHNTTRYSKASTKIADDWAIVLLIKYRSRHDALTIERYIKKMKSRKFIESLIHDTDFFAKFKVIVQEKFGIEVVQ